MLEIPPTKAGTDQSDGPGLNSHLLLSNYRAAPLSSLSGDFDV